MTIGKFRIEEAIDQAYAEFDKLEDNQKNHLSIVLLSRKYAPHNAQHVVDCITEDRQLLYLGQPEGHLLIDGLVSAIGEVIGAAVLNKHNEAMNTKNAKEAKQQVLRDQLLGR